MALVYSEPDQQHFIQLGYHVADLDEAMTRWNAVTGAGPFLIRRHIPLAEILYRGEPSTLEIGAAMTQLGGIQIELIQQHCDTPSTFRDMFDRTQTGLHHVAVAPRDECVMLDHYRDSGFPIATSFMTQAGGGAHYVDARPQFGYMVEIYRVSDRIVQLYERVAAEAERWDGRELVIDLEK